MSRSTGNRSAAPRKNGNPFLTGVLVGMVIGAGMAAGMAWYIMKSPSPFVHKEQVTAKPLADIANPVAPESAASNAQPTAAASGVVDSKPRFEFYKVLTDKQDAPLAAPVKPADRPQPAKPQTAEGKPAANEPYFLQAGSFSNAADAERLKARLALLGIEASTQTATIPDKGVWHRVRLGPYKNANEMDRARSLLKQNGVEATPIRAQ